MYGDDSTLDTSATTVTEMTATLNKELQLVSEWVARNKLVLNISKNKSIVFGTNHSLNPKPQLNILMNHVEMNNAVTLDCKRSWSKQSSVTPSSLVTSISTLFITRLRFIHLQD